MKLAWRICGGSGRSARRHRLHQGESAVTVHLDDPDRLLDVVVARELEATQRRVNVDRLHGVAKLGAVAGNVAKGQVGALGRIGEDQDGGIALRGELVRVATVLRAVRLDKPGV